MQCAAHPGIETFLKCGRCETPICGRCTVQTPVGARCRSCAGNKASPLYHASARQYAFAALAALAAGLVLGWLPRIFIFLGPIMYGYAVAEAALRAGNRRRSLGMQLIAGAAALVGTLIWMLAMDAGSLVHVFSPHSLTHFGRILTDPFNLIALGLGVGCAAVHVRYI